MSGFLLNVLLAVVWALLSGDVNLRELGVGFGLGYLLLRLFPDALGTRAYVRASVALLRFLGTFLRELTVANVQVALLALRARPNLNAMIFSVPLRPHTDLSLTLLTATVTLMPGSVVLGFDAGRTRMYMHGIGLASPEEARAGVKNVERLLLDFLPAPTGGRGGAA